MAHTPQVVLGMECQVLMNAQEEDKPPHMCMEGDFNFVGLSPVWVGVEGQARGGIECYEPSLALYNCTSLLCMYSDKYLVSLSSLIQTLYEDHVDLFGTLHSACLLACHACLSCPVIHCLFFSLPVKKVWRRYFLYVLHISL